PRGVVHGDENRFVGSRQRVAGFRNAKGVEVAADITRGVGLKATEQPVPAVGQLGDGLILGEGGTHANAPARSLVSESAAIQPDISTIGMPGPGWAAPPARYRPFTSGERLPGLNAPSHLPWLARP